MQVRKQRYKNSSSSSSKHYTTLTLPSETELQPKHACIYACIRVCFLYDTRDKGVVEKKGRVLVSEFEVEEVREREGLKERERDEMVGEILASMQAVFYTQPSLS